MGSSIPAGTKPHTCRHYYYYIYFIITASQRGAPILCGIQQNTLCTTQVGPTFYNKQYSVKLGPQSLVMWHCWASSLMSASCHFSTRFHVRILLYYIYIYIYCTSLLVLIYKCMYYTDRKYCICLNTRTRKKK